MKKNSLMTRRDFLRMSALTLNVLGLTPLRGIARAHMVTGKQFLVGVNYPWIAYGHDFGKNDWGHDGLITSGWTYQTWEDSQGFTDTRRCTDNAHTGVASLCITADLMGQDPNKGRGEVYVDLQNHPPPGVSVPLNLDGVTVRCWLWLPKGSAGKENARNGVQLFCKSEGWWSWYSQWVNIQPEWEEKWVEFTENLSDPPGYKDPDFDPTKVIAIGLKVAINDSSDATLKGIIYLDDYVLEADPQITFDFEQLEVERDFITLQTTLQNCSTPVVRVFVFADGRASPDFNETSGEVVEFDEYFFQDFDALLTVAKEQNLLLIPVLLDFWWCDSPKDENDVQLGGHSDIIRYPETFLKNALIPFLETYPDNPQIAMLDIINEPEWAMSGVPEQVLVGDPVAVKEMQDFVQACAETIHTYSLHKVTVGSASLKWLDYWRGLGLDLYQFHWYDHLGDPFPWPPYAKHRLDKPCFIGEVPTANTQYSATRYLKVACNRGYHGLLVWSYRASDEFSDFARAELQLKRWCARPSGLCG